MHTTKRRDFLKTSMAAAALGAPAAMTAHAAQAKSTVSAIRGTNLDAMTREAIDALGGMKKVVKKGETVFVKPNLVNFPWAKTNRCFQIGECTKPEIIIAVIEECLKAGASKVIVGDGAQFPKFDWKYAITLDGKANLVDEARRLSAQYKAKVQLACLEVDSPGWVDLPSVTHLHKIAISSLMAKADRVISLPVAKTHSWAQLTLALKNFIGVAPFSRYGQLIDGTWWNRGTFDHRTPKALAQVYLDIVKNKPVDLSLIDFSICLEADGPSVGQGGRTIDMKKRLGSWAIVASRDIMAADATAARIMSHDVNRVKQLTMGFKMGLGEIREDRIEVVGEKLDNMRVKWQPARLKASGRPEPEKKG